MKKKVFASDFDGTMYFYKAPDPDKLPAANVEWIRRYQQAGHLFGLCSLGRSCIASNKIERISFREYTK